MNFETRIEPGSSYDVSDNFTPYKSTSVIYNTLLKIKTTKSKNKKQKTQANGKHENFRSH